MGGWCAAAVALFLLVVTRQPLGRIAAACVDMGPAVLLAPCVALVLIATRTRALQLVVGEWIPWRVVFGIRAIGDGYNALVPAAGVAGEPYKLRRLTAWLSLDGAVSALVRDRMFDNAFGLVVSAAGIAIGLPTLAGAAVITGALWTYAAIAAPVGLVLVWIAAGGVPGRLGALVSRWVKAKPHAGEPLPLDTVLRISAWCLVTRAIQMLETTLLLALVGAPIDVPSVLLVDGALNAAGFVGFVMPQGLGVVEGAAVCIVTALGVSPAEATAFALARRGRVIVVSAAGVLVHVAGRLRAHLRPPA